MQPEKLQAVRPVDPLPCRQWKLLKINVSESMLSPSLPMSLHARRSPSGQAHSEPARGTKDWKIAAVNTQSMYCSALRNKFDKTIIGWYDASASNFSTDQRRAKHFVDRVDADLVADRLRRMYPRLAEQLRAVLRGDKLLPAAEAVEIVRALPHGHVLAALGTARRIALDAVLPRRAPQRRRDLALALIVARLLEPAAKLATTRMLD